MHKTKKFPSFAVVTAVALVGASVSSCSSESQNDNAADIIATTNVWADVAAAVTGSEVAAIISDASIDPHHFEPAAKDLARVKAANLVVANGGHYDQAIYRVAEQDRVIFAVPPHAHDEHDHDHEHDHGHDHDHEGHDHEGHDHEHGWIDTIPESMDELEHVWFATSKVKDVATQVADRTGGSADDVVVRMDAIQQRLDSFKHVHLAMTEPIAAPLIWGTELHDITPESYLLATLNEVEPSASAVAETLALIESGFLDFLVVNPQSTNSATDRLAQAAKDNNLPIVEIRETPPEGMNFLDYFEQVVHEIEAIVDAAEPRPDTELPRFNN
ncbi:metal ABC transporter solute-binding protein, Zn/Mn family [Corynebacterium riegelii]|uniref:metal ABC transporter solute-binding protein, Zn/Mn family n=1 Tax=Corynebacterium riegelii TaxID=156976 RepID=UPI002889B11E|nr:zinc ABC transporter substrate-binding protein [Corynebacterium riegelii]